MKLIAALVLCGIVALTYAETEEKCGCDSLKQCVDEQKAHMKAMFHECGEICEPELGDAASDLKACFENMTTKMASFEKEKGNCFFDPEHKMCASSRSKREFMSHHRHGKHHGGSGSASDEEESRDGEHDEWENHESKHHKHNGGHHNRKHGSNSASHEARQDGERDEWENHESKHHKHNGGHHHNKHGNECGHKKRHHSNPLHKKMQPFHECMKQCFHEKHQMEEKHHGKEHHRKEHHEHGFEGKEHHHQHHNQHDKHGHHHGGWWMKKCEKQLNCTILKVAAMETMKVCHPKSAASKGKFYQMKIETCECMRDAFKIDASKMTCEPSHEEGIHHHWHGGHKHVHYGSHFD